MPTFFSTAVSRLPDVLKPAAQILKLKPIAMRLVNSQLTWIGCIFVVTWMRLLLTFCFRRMNAVSALYEGGITTLAYP